MGGFVVTRPTAKQKDCQVKGQVIIFALWRRSIINRLIVKWCGGVAEPVKSRIIWARTIEIAYDGYCLQRYAFVSARLL